MTERPILFSAPMARALLDGSKTQTRRVVKCHVEDYGGILHTKTVCPYGQPGDRLWVREAWAAESEFDAIAPKDLRIGQRIYYPADKFMSEDKKWFTQEPRPIEKAREYWRVRSSIYMPRWVSRITLEITGVRVERLRDISEPDCKAEGAKGGNGSIPGYHYSATPHEHYRHIWESINGTGSWDANPWVWVVEFKTKGTV
jgi:hypothetical protein